MFATPQQQKQEEDLRQLLLDLVAKGQTEEAIDLALGLYSKMRDQNTHLNLRLAKALRVRFGRSSEKLDANQLAGIEHELFGTKVGAGLRALNPGLSRGVLRAGGGELYKRDGIYLLPETVSDLPPVSGILTLGAGSSLSHVQLLARNLGIPNVVVAEELLAAVRARIGDPVVLAVSPNGVVQLADDGLGLNRNSHLYRSGTTRQLGSWISASASS